MTYITSVEEIGIKAGIKAGKEKGRQETEQRIVLSMLKKGISVEDIAEITELSIEQVKEIQSQQK